MENKKDVFITDSLKDLFDIESAFLRLQSLSDVLIDYIMDYSETNSACRQDNINFTLMTIRDYAEFYANQVQNLHIVDGELKPLQAAG
ncbi:MAG: hypothetical protein J1E96_04565 [Ruminococcus sp.]|nr:hypothetical protein [Ruminococcus sp.]